VYLNLKLKEFLFKKNDKLFTCPDEKSGHFFVIIFMQPIKLVVHLSKRTMTIFSKIIAGEIPSYKVAENDHFFAFLDIFPLAVGHVLVVPKVETDKFFDLDKSYLAEMLVFAQPIAKALEAAFPCNRCGISVVGLEVPHAHMHLVPINDADDLNFTRGKLKLTAAELQEVHQKILTALG
jgi:histidine triad (HIT) family protein